MTFLLKSVLLSATVATYKNNINLDYRRPYLKSKQASKQNSTTANTPWVSDFPWEHLRHESLRPCLWPSESPRVLQNPKGSHHTAKYERLCHKTTRTLHEVGKNNPSHRKHMKISGGVYQWGAGCSSQTEVRDTVNTLENQEDPFLQGCCMLTLDGQDPFLWGCCKHIRWPGPFPTMVLWTH